VDERAGEPGRELEVQRQVPLDERDVANRFLPVERDERERDPLAPAFAQELPSPEVDASLVLRLVPARKRFHVARVVGKQLHPDRGFSIFEQDV
jgi:hypothetical protein